MLTGTSVSIESYDHLKWCLIDSIGKVFIKLHYDEVLPDMSDLSLYRNIERGYFKNGLATIYLKTSEITELVIDRKIM